MSHVVVEDPVALGFHPRTVGFIRYLLRDDPTPFRSPRTWQHLSTTRLLREVARGLDDRLAALKGVTGAALWNWLALRVLAGHPGALVYSRAYLDLPDLPDDDAILQESNGADRAMGSWGWLPTAYHEAVVSGRIPLQEPEDLCILLSGLLRVLGRHRRPSPRGVLLCQLLRDAPAGLVLEWMSVNLHHPDLGADERAVALPILGALEEWKLTRVHTEPGVVRLEMERYILHALVNLGEVVREGDIASRGAWRGMQDGIDRLLR